MSNNKNRYIEKEKKKNKEIKNIKKANKHISLGLIVYFLIFTYLIFCVINFSFSKKTNFTIAEPGKIVESEIFNGIIIKNETVVKSNGIGKSNYLIPEGRKVKKGTLVSFVDVDENISSVIKESLEKSKSKELSSLDFSLNDKMIQDKLKDYVINKDNRNFSYTYTAKEEIEKTIYDISNTILPDDNKLISNLLKESSIKEENIYYSPNSGVISYKFDGFEDLNIEEFTPEIFKQAIDKKDALINTNSIDVGTPLFKTVDNYRWYLAAEINDICEKFLEGKSTANIYINYNNVEAKAKINKIIHDDYKTYVILEFDRYLNEFLNERFLSFTVIYSHSKGIKIPLTAITNKEFLKIPIEALLKSNQTYEVKKKIINEKLIGGESLEGIIVHQFKTNNQDAYIPASDKIGVGDTIVYSFENGANMEFTIEESIPIEGVYVINKGYAAFKFIEVLSSSEDYKIVKDTTPYGVNSYDRIATDASIIKENQLIN